MASCVGCKVIGDLESIDHLCIDPIHRIGLIHRRSIVSHWLGWRGQVNVLLDNCRRNSTSLSLLVGTTVDNFTVYIYQYMFESRLSERSTLPEFFLKNIYV